MQRPCFLEACLAVDAARLHLPVMHLARLLGKGWPDILGIRLQMGAKAFEERIGLFALAEPISDRGLRSARRFFTAGAIGAFRTNRLPQSGQMTARALAWTS